MFNEVKFRNLVLLLLLLLGWLKTEEAKKKVLKNSLPNEIIILFSHIFWQHKVFPWNLSEKNERGRGREKERETKGESRKEKKTFSENTIGRIESNIKFYCSKAKVVENGKNENENNRKKTQK